MSADKLTEQSQSDKASAGPAIGSEVTGGPAANDQSAGGPVPPNKPRIATPVGTTVGNATFIAGGLGNIRGLRCAGVSAGFRKNPQRRDFALLVCEQPTVASGLFTQNRFAAGPVIISQRHLAASKQPTAADNPAAAGMRAIIINSGQANAATGKPGEEIATAATQMTAAALGCTPEQVLVASTGVIGAQLSLANFEQGVSRAAAALGRADGSDLESGLQAAEAIMTTDTYAKQAAVQVELPNAKGQTTTCRIAGMVKGSGMIEPHMATLLGVFATDAQLSQAAADQVFKSAVDKSLNRLTVDSDTSTNDTVFFLATGAAGGDCIEIGATADASTNVAADGPAIVAHDSSINAVAYQLFEQALTTLCVELTRQLAADGEGASKLVTVRVSGALNAAAADQAARAVANSPLVKTAIAGHDANWGRIAMALGKSGADFDQANVSITMLGLPVLANGLPVAFDEATALALFESEPEVVITADLGTGGNGQAVIWTCDLTHGYITINGDYRS